MQKLIILKMIELKIGRFIPSKNMFE